MPFIIPALLVFFAASCKKTSVLTNGGEISFSLDTLVFDTVFTAQGSSTRSLKIYNKQKQNITLTSIRLKHGDSSAYRLNVNGIPGTKIENVDVAGNDSVWVFAAVTIDPTDENSPFVVDDSLIVALNGREFSIPVMAYGQNAHYIRDSVLTTQTWLTDKPYVIINNAIVDEGATLTIPAGVRVYVHQDSRLYVLGSLKINGTQTDSVVFQGDRLDPLVWIGDYIDIPGQWGGIYFFQQSYGNEINYAVFKNGGAATKLTIDTNTYQIQAATIQCDPDTVHSGTAKLKMTNTTIRSSLGIGLLAFNSSIDMENCKVVECGGGNVYLLQGGNYKLYDCTIATFGSQYLDHSKNISMAVQNYYSISQSQYNSADLLADIKNCLIYGSLETELYFDSKPDNTAAVMLSNCLVKAKDAYPNFVTQINNILNQDPVFKDYSKGDYHLDASSPAVANGISAGSINTDLDGVLRANPPAIGCYEFTP